MLGGGGTLRAFVRALSGRRAAAAGGGPPSALLIRHGEVRLNPGSAPTDPNGSTVTVRRLLSTSQSSVDPKEMRKFQLLAHKWWDEQGEYSALHSMNDIRVPFIRDTLLNMGGTYQQGSPLGGIKVLDVGCGGGLLSEPLGRLGASVTGIDPLEENIRTADLHKSFDPVLAKRIQYKLGSLEEIVEESVETFDVIVASEVVEHVADLELFIKCCSQVLKNSVVLYPGNRGCRKNSRHCTRRNTRVGEVCSPRGAGAPLGSKWLLCRDCEWDAVQPPHRVLELDGKHKH
ncbi:ubiquinone biosynthesis O-methyltransferase, mitochondrial isoform X2 [Excalfactoria chinensis]|uniref:ubiquinone biosynthesis O-methyltransferase, mitochondrial isoform X2 n=1 Tax=Excalfactoria chinensis TaxID=46218 RepID=UPI003B3A2C99